MSFTPWNLIWLMSNVQRSGLLLPVRQQSKTGKSTTETTGADGASASKGNQKDPQLYITPLFPSVPLEWSQMKERYCSGSSNCLKISSWHEFKNSVWNVNALDNSSFPAGVLPHKTRKPSKSRAWDFGDAPRSHRPNSSHPPPGPL